MTEVPTVRNLSHPLKTARHLYTLVPFLGDKLYFVDDFREGRITEERFNKYLKELDFWFLSNSKKKNEILKEACRHILNNKIVGGIEVYHKFHKLVYPRLEDKLHGKKCMLISGSSKDAAGERTICVDPLSSNFKLTDDMIPIFDKLGGLIDLSKWMFLSIAPVISPFYYKGKGEIDFIFRDEWEAVSERNEADNKKPVGDASKNMAKQDLFRRGFYQFNEILYDFGKAKRMGSKVKGIKEDISIEDFEERVKIGTQMNRELLAYAVSKIIRYCDKKIDIYAAKTSFSYEVSEKAVKYYNRRNNDNQKEISSWGVLKGIDNPYEGIHHRTSLKRLEKRLLNKSRNYTNDISDMFRK